MIRRLRARRGAPATLATIASAVALGCTAQAPVVDVRLQVLQAEDARAAEPEQLALLRSALADADAEVRALATRALGRLERADVLDDLLGRLHDADAGVRVQAAFALGQSAQPQTLDDITMPLYLALSRDPDEGVRAVAAWSLGRLPYAQRPELLVDAQRVLLRATEPAPSGHEPAVPPAQLQQVPPNRRPGAPAAAERLVGVLRGVEALLRRHREAIELLPELRQRLRDMAMAPGPERPDEIRALALAALGAARALDAEVVEAALTAPERESRRLAAEALAVVSIDGTRQEGALRDADAGVRLGAVRAMAARGNCAAVRGALQDADAHVRLLAIDRLDVCTDAVATLSAQATGLTEATDDWHAPAHALVTLARVAPAAAADAMRAAMRHPAWQVRAYAAAAADAAGDEAALRSLASDAHANVRAAAIEALSRRAGNAADALYVEALAVDDPQLTIAAAAALAGSDDAAALPALRAALDRLAGADAQTLRDARAALRQRIEELSGQPAGPVAEPAGRAWVTGLQPLRDLEGAEAVLTMRRGGDIVLRLLPWEAPTSALRFADTARAGAFDGLTFHRVVANFVIQGGSPGANEYAGHGAYTRDEIGVRSHRRGTVGISTRGRDTGDGQIFINLVDNVRLDGDYTIFAEVVAGMDVVDAVLEGDVIERVRLRPPR